MTHKRGRGRPRLYEALRPVTMKLPDELLEWFDNLPATSRHLRMAYLRTAITELHAALTAEQSVWPAYLDEEQEAQTRGVITKYAAIAKIG